MLKPFIRLILLAVIPALLMDPCLADSRSSIHGSANLYPSTLFVSQAITPELSLSEHHILDHKGKGLHYRRSTRRVQTNAYQAALVTLEQELGYRLSMRARDYARSFFEHPHKVAAGNLVRVGFQTYRWARIYRCFEIDPYTTAESVQHLLDDASKKERVHIAAHFLSEAYDRYVECAKASGVQAASPDRFMQGVLGLLVMDRRLDLAKDLIEQEARERIIQRRVSFPAGRKEAALLGDAVLGVIVSRWLMQYSEAAPSTFDPGSYFAYLTSNATLSGQPGAVNKRQMATQRETILAAIFLAESHFSEGLNRAENKAKEWFVESGLLRHELARRLEVATPSTLSDSPPLALRIADALFLGERWSVKLNLDQSSQWQQAYTKATSKSEKERAQSKLRQELDIVTQDAYAMIERLSETHYWPSEIPLFSIEELPVFGGVPTTGIVTMILTEWITRAVEAQASTAHLSVDHEKSNVVLEWKVDSPAQAPFSAIPSIVDLIKKTGWELSEDLRSGWTTIFLRIGFGKVDDIASMPKHVIGAAVRNGNEFEQKISEEGYLADDSPVSPGQLKQWLEQGGGTFSDGPLEFKYRQERALLLVQHQIRVYRDHHYAGHIDFFYNPPLRHAWMDMAIVPTHFVRAAIEVAPSFRHQGLGHRLLDLAKQLVELEGAMDFTAKQVHPSNYHFYVHAGFRHPYLPSSVIQWVIAQLAKGRSWAGWLFPTTDFRYHFNSNPSARAGEQSIQNAGASALIRSA